MAKVNVMEELRAERTRLASELGAVEKALAALGDRGARNRTVRKRTAPTARKLSPKGRKAIAEAAKARWKAYRAAKAASR